MRMEYNNTSYTVLAVVGRQETRNSLPSRQSGTAVIYLSRRHNVTRRLTQLHHTETKIRVNTRPIIMTWDAQSHYCERTPSASYPFIV
ncbi:hypothetical protein M404DRAFT_603174 [Pisolithus tinctorius Marx 270]|uniref:Uncharacterized protein n=1 Tax=Pisolithus tinctorius Marx 270 TaxID=870435 RepID=A0A0C3NTA0_PISTI|nr:hypothetical protein M404DRAFT_603174 [Pisolithus tinctorius Marx 270]